MDKLTKKIIKNLTSPYPDMVMVNYWMGLRLAQRLNKTVSQNGPSENASKEWGKQ